MCKDCHQNRATDTYRLSVLSPFLSEEWNYDKNKTTPYDVAANSSQFAWWKCSICGYEWEAQIMIRYQRSVRKNIKSRLRNINNSATCPYCLSFVSRRPELLKEWDYDKNKIDPISVGLTTDKYHWKCHICSYEWLDSVFNRADGHGKCLRCNSIGTLYPELVKEFDLDKNKMSPYFVNHGSSQKVWWKCLKCGHSWFAVVNSRVRGNGCPKCKTIVLKDGTKCLSKAEAYWYLKFKGENKEFIHDKEYGGIMGRRRYDFYFLLDNTYVEITDFHKKSFRVKGGWISYLRNIVKKKRYVKNILHANFKFIQYRLTNKDRKFVRENMAPVIS